MSLDEVRTALRGSRCNVFFRMIPGTPYARAYFWGTQANQERLRTPDFERSFNALVHLIVKPVCKSDTDWCPAPDEHRSTWIYTADKGAEAGFSCATCARLRQEHLEKFLQMLDSGAEPPFAI